MLFFALAFLGLLDLTAAVVLAAPDVRGLVGLGHHNPNPLDLVVFAILGLSTWVCGRGVALTGPGAVAIDFGSDGVTLVFQHHRSIRHAWSDNASAITFRAPPPMHPRMGFVAQSIRVGTLELSQDEFAALEDAATHSGSLPLRFEAWTLGGKKSFVRL